MSRKEREIQKLTLRQTITLTRRNSTTITFTWNTTGVPYGNYTISAIATPVPGETNITDNTYPKRLGYSHV